MRTGKRTDAALASLQQLCSMGLSNEMAIPALMNLMPDWIAVEDASFFWVDAQLQPVHYYTKTAYRDAAEQFSGRSECLDIPGMSSFSDYLRHHTSMMHGGPEDPGYFRSATYNEVLRPTGACETLLCVAVRDHAGRPRGSIALGRDQRTHAFSAQEKKQAELLAQHLTNLFAPSTTVDGERFERCNAQGMALLDAFGKPIHCDETARQLLFMAGHPDFSSSTLARLHGEQLSHQLRQLCVTLEHMFAGRPALPPTFSLQRPAGRFVFRARHLSQAPSSELKVIGLDIAHYLPRRLVTWRRVQALNLPVRLQQVCLEYAEGASLSEIAALLGISRHTVIDHVNRIYERFGLEPSRELLQEYLQSSS